MWLGRGSKRAVVVGGHAATDWRHSEVAGLDLAAGDTRPFGLALMR